MNIENMSDWRKTVCIIELMPGWEVWGIGGDGDDIVLQIDGRETAVLRSPDYLYAPKWMFLAWRVLNWAVSTSNGICNNAHRFYLFSNIDQMPPEEAQRALLDKILSLAIEAGMVEGSE